MVVRKIWTPQIQSGDHFLYTFHIYIYVYIKAQANFNSSLKVKCYQTETYQIDPIKLFKTTPSFTTLYCHI